MNELVTSVAGFIYYYMLISIGPAIVRRGKYQNQLFISNT